MERSGGSARPGELARARQGARLVTTPGEEAETEQAFFRPTASELTCQSDRVDFLTQP